MTNVDEEMEYLELSYFFMEVQMLQLICKKYSQLLTMKQFNDLAFLLPCILLR